MIQEFVQACLEVGRQLRELPGDQAARLRAAAMDRNVPPESTVRDALGDGADPALVSRLAASVAAVAELAPRALDALSSDEGRALLNRLEPHALAEVAALVASFARQAGSADRLPAATVLSALVPKLQGADTERLVRRVVRQLFVAGPAEVSSAALPALLGLGARFTPDDQLLGRLDLLLALRWNDDLAAPIGEHLAADPRALDLLLVQGSGGAAPERWRAAHLLRCLAGRPHDAGGLGLDPVALCATLLKDESVRVWRAAASSLGHLAAKHPRARSALQSFVDPKAPISHRRHGAAGLGALRSSAPTVVDEGVRRILKRGSDPWLVASLAFALPDLADTDAQLFSDLVSRLLAAPGTAALLNLAQVLGELAETGGCDLLHEVIPQVVEAARAWQPRDPGQAALRWAALDALRVDAEDLPLALGSCCRVAARLVLDEENRAVTEQQVRRALDLGYAQLRRIDEMDTSAGIEGRGRLLFEIRDLARSLFEEDLLFAVLRILKADDDGRIAALEADYEQLRRQSWTRLLGNAGALESYDQPRRTEIVRGITLALDGRSSSAGTLEARLDDRAARARRLAGFDALRAIAQRPEKHLRRMAASALARQLDCIGATSELSLLESTLCLLAPLPDPDLLADVARAASEKVSPLVQAAAAAARDWVEEPDLAGVVTAGAFRRLAKPAPQGLLRSALLDLAAVIEHLSAIATAEAIAAPFGEAGQPPLVLLARSAHPLAAALLGGTDGLRSELLGTQRQSDEAEEVCQRLERAREAAGSLGQRLEQLAGRVTDVGQRFADTAEPPARLELALDLEKAVDELLLALREGVELPLGAGVELALEGWREALETEIAAARAASATLEQQRLAEAPKARPEPERPRFPETIGPGKRIGDFELLSMLGKGGMGIVFKARQVSLDRFVALKVMLPGVATDAGSVERFRREAQVMGRWCHDNILRVIDYRDDGPAPYLVMELVDGESLAHLVEAGGIGPARAVEIGLAVARALAHAHKDGVVHRDVSSGNVMIRRDGQILLMDFGISLLLDRTRLSIPGIAFGNPTYMSPEQCTVGGVVGPPADVYALGTLLFELLSGKLPFEGTTVKELATRKVSGDPPSLAGICPGLPAGLCALVHRMIETDPNRRPDAEEVAGSLARLARQLDHPAQGAYAAGQVQVECREVHVVCMMLRNLESIADADEQKNMLSWWYRNARAAIEQHGGVCDRHISHRVYGYFGVPAPAPDDGEQALRAMSGAHRAVRRLAQSSGEAVSLRAGLARGPALVGQVENASPSLVVVGAVVERAEALARSDLDAADLRTDEAVYRSTAHRVAFHKRQATDRSCGRVFFLHV